MPEINSPQVTMAEDDLRSAVRNHGTLPARKWSCPEDHMVAAYADGTIDGLGKKWVEFHLSGCLRCRLVVADAVKAQRETDLPSPPAELKWKATGFAASETAQKPWVWVPAGTLAAIALLIATSMLLRKPQSLVIQSPPSPSAPMIAKSEPAAASGAALRDLVRKPTSSEPLPSIVFPRPDSTLSREQLTFGWKSVAQSRYYEVHVVTADGDLVWEGQTDKSNLQMPGDV